MASVEPTFRLATVEDAPAMLGVIEAAFGRWPAFDIPVSPLEHLEWKMQPPGLPARHQIGEMDGRAMVAQLRWMSECLVDGETWLANDGADKAIHPEYQGRGFNLLLSQAMSRSGQPGRVGIGTPSRNERALKTQARIGDPRSRRELLVWARGFDLRTQLGTHLRSGGARHLLGALPSLLGRRGGSMPPPSGTSIEVIEQFDDRTDALWEAASAVFDVAKLRRAQYLNWRYADPRSGRGVILGAFAGASAVAGGALLGFAVFRRDGDRANLADLLTHPEHREVLAPLIAAGCARLRADGCKLVTAWLPTAHPDAAALGAAGFDQIGRRVVLEFDVVPGQEPDAAILARFAAPSLRVHVTMGDFDFT